MSALWIWAAGVRVELDRLSAKDRRAVTREVSGQLQRKPAFVGLAICVSVLFSAAQLAAFWFVIRRMTTGTPGLRFFLLTFTIGLAAGLLASLLPIYLLRRRVQRLVRAGVRPFGVRVCLACGYDLRGSQGDACCPECGARDGASITR